MSGPCLWCAFVHTVSSAVYLPNMKIQAVTTSVLPYSISADLTVWGVYVLCWLELPWLTSTCCQNVCCSSSQQALLRGDGTAGLFHPTPAAGCRHGWHFSGASLPAEHWARANHSAQHQHNLHHRWVWQPQTVSLGFKFVFWQLLYVIACSSWVLAAGWPSVCLNPGCGACSASFLFRKIEKITMKCKLLSNPHSRYYPGCFQSILINFLDNKMSGNPSHHCRTHWRIEWLILSLNSAKQLTNCHIWEARIRDFNVKCPPFFQVRHRDQSPNSKKWSRQEWILLV